MRKLIAGTLLALVLAVSVSGCIVETTPWEIGGSCDYVGDQDCYSIQRLYFCGSDYRIQYRDCGMECSGYPAACCGYDPTYADDNCLCCMDASCSGATCFGR